VEPQETSSPLESSQSKEEVHPSLSLDVDERVGRSFKFTEVEGTARYSRRRRRATEAVWAAENMPTAQIDEVTKLASTIFEDPQFAQAWLNRPNLATDNKPPIALLGNEEGLARVETLLRRIEYGVLA
jgi:putative toxin-antitoxin system antitoxin component (TIGR02293 family)